MRNDFIFEVWPYLFDLYDLDDDFNYFYNTLLFKFNTCFTFKVK